MMNDQLENHKAFSKFDVSMLPKAKIFGKAISKDDILDA